MLHTEKQKTFQHIIKSLWCLCKKRILYKYQVTFIVFSSFYFEVKCKRTCQTIECGVSSTALISLKMSNYMYRGNTNHLLI